MGSVVRLESTAELSSMSENLQGQGTCKLAVDIFSFQKPSFPSKSLFRNYICAMTDGYKIPVDNWCGILSGFSLESYQTEVRSQWGARKARNAQLQSWLLL
jgi:hypothetical protein